VLHVDRMLIGMQVRQDTTFVIDMSKQTVIDGSHPYHRYHRTTDGSNIDPSVFIHVLRHIVRFLS
jgi:hypothetical protein